MVTIILCGTPGTGKSTLIEILKKDLPEFHFYNISEFAIENDCILDYDDFLETQVIDEDRLVEKLEPLLKENEYNFVESIHADLFTPEMIDWVYVCRVDNTKLYDRLKARGYNDEKVSNNVQAEIFQTIYDEALSSIGVSKLTELQNNDETDLERNSGIILADIKRLKVSTNT